MNSTVPSSSSSPVPPWTIGQLARRVNLNPSALRFYEEQGLLEPAGRSEAGYRLYNEGSEQTVRLIQRAQRLGFSLDDIRLFLNRSQAGDLDGRQLLAVAEQRYVAIERQLTEWLVQRHEMGLFLQDLRQRTGRAADISVGMLFDDLLARACDGPHFHQPAGSLEWLFKEMGCRLTTAEGQALFETLTGVHVHVWQTKDAFSILIVDHSPAVEQVVRRLAQLETDCDVHLSGENRLDLERVDDGLLLTCSGPHAFLYARLFLSISAE